jgi:hypothetical protein
LAPKSIRTVIGPEGDYRIEAVSTAQLSDLKIEHAGQFALADARFDVRERLPEGPGRDRSSGPDRGNLALVLDDPRRFYDVFRRSQSRFDGLFQPLELGHRSGFFNGYRPDGFEFLHKSGHGVRHRPGAIDYLTARAFLLSLLGVSAVGQKIDLPAGDSRPAIVSQKARGVSYICRLCHYQTAYSLLLDLSANRPDAFSYHFSVHCSSFSRIQGG